MREAFQTERHNKYSKIRIIDDQLGQLKILDRRQFGNSKMIPD